MGFFDFLRGNPEERAAREAALQRQTKSLAALKRGGLPVSAVERLKHQRSTQELPTHLWTSDLSVAELALVGDVGYEPLGQVMGASIFHVGFEWQNYSLSTSTSKELKTLSKTFSRARQLAVNRLQQEAQLLGADGVVGVRLERKNDDWSGGSVEFRAIGTAIRERDTPPRPKEFEPFTCALSGQDFWKLKQSGLEPVGLVAGNCTYCCVPGLTTQAMATGEVQFTFGAWQNQELPELTRALPRARKIAMQQLTEQALQVGADGTVGMTIEHDIEFTELESKDREKRLAMLIHFLALGTAVRVVQDEPSLKTSRVMSLQIMPVRPASAHNS